MGSAHAISGAAAWVAVTATTVPALGVLPMGPEGVIIGGIVAAGAALLPDADHPQATIAHSFPGAGLVTGAIGAASGGHRKGLHSAVAVIVAVAAAFAMSLVVWTPTWLHGGGFQVGSSVSVMACVAIAVKTLKLVRGWVAAWAVGAVIAIAVMVWAPANLAWLPMSVGVGYATHLLGDLLTVQGIPVLWPLQPKPPKSLRRTAVGWFWRPGGAFAVPVLGHAGSWREWALTLPLAAYVLWGFVTAGIAAVQAWA